jgi:hypothetical protein
LYFTGSNDTWHGFVDIFLNQTVAVSVIARDQNPPDDDDDDDTNDKDDNNDASKAIPGPSSSKRLRMHVDPEIGIDKQKNTLLHFNVLDQIIAEAITNAFAQVNNSKDLSGWLIPSFGCTLDRITVFLYDPKKDVLLQLATQMPLLDETNEMSITTVVHIWMLLNFTVFMYKNIAGEYAFKCSNFHHLTGCLLKKYRDLQPGKAFSTGISYNDVYSDVLLQAILVGEEIHKVSQEPLNQRC